MPEFVCGAAAPGSTETGARRGGAVRAVCAPSAAGISMATSACPVCRARFPAGDLKVSVRLRDLVESTPVVSPAQGGGGGAMDCCICLERLRDPVTLPCGHDGCLACLNRLPTIGAPLAVAPAVDHRNRILNPATGRMVLDTAANRRRAAGQAAARSPSPAAVRARQAWRFLAGLRRQSTWSAAARARDFSHSAALAYAGGWLAFYFARSLVCLAVGMHHLSGEELEGWQPWIAKFMVGRELAALTSVIACTWYNPACLLHRAIGWLDHRIGDGGNAAATPPFRLLWPELYLPATLFMEDMPNYSRRADGLGMKFCRCLILSDFAIFAVPGGLAAGTLPAMLAASHAITSGRILLLIASAGLSDAIRGLSQQPRSWKVALEFGFFCMCIAHMLQSSYLLCLPDVNALPSQHYNAAVGCHAMTTACWGYVFASMPKVDRQPGLSWWLLVWVALTLTIFSTYSSDHILYIF